MRLADAHSLMSSRHDLDRAGVATREITARVCANSLVRVDRGWYAETDAWNGAYSEGRHLMRVVAAAARRRENPGLVFSHVSAAALWGLPLFRIEPRRVHLSGAAASGHVRASGPLVARHEVEVPAADVSVRDGIACTSLARTVADTLRATTWETGVALADAALRHVAWDERRLHYDIDAADALRADVTGHLPRGGRGVRQAREVIAFADGRAASTGESVSRLYLRDLGFAAPRLQVPIASPAGTNYYVDFALDDADAWGEYDGEGKYLAADLRGADTDIETALMNEKMREDWIRGRTQRAFARWSKAHVVSAIALGLRLGAFGIRPPR